jgi:molybdopterin-binding protein
MKISARNVLRGKVLGVQRGATTAHVRLDIGGGATVTASITRPWTSWASRRAWTPAP